MNESTAQEIKALINSNQIAIKQLGQDIIALDIKINKRSLQVQQEMSTVRRDIHDRWDYLTAISRRVEEIIKKEV